MELNGYKILAFGVIAEKINATEFNLSNVSSTNELREIIYNQYPQLKKITIALSINRNIVNEDVPLIAGSEIALLPPYSGG
jgi:sulfur-carrier protein